MKCLIRSIFAWSLAGGMCIAETEKADNHFYGEAYITGGQIYRGLTRKEGPVSHVWNEEYGFVLGDSVTVNEKSIFRLEFGLGTTYSYTPMIGNKDFGNWVNRFPFNFPILEQAYATRIFGDVEKRPFTVTLGIFQYKYNPDVQNLGEYLFRSMCYPNFIIAKLDYPKARLVGMKLSSRLFDGALTSDLIFSTETDAFPRKDFSLSLVEGFNIGKFASVGAGVQAYHILPVDGSLTTPVYAAEKSTNAPGYYYKTAEDSASNTKSYYTYSGTKLMARLNLAPLSIVPPIELPVLGTIFGKNDLKMFIEANMLGLKSYPIYSMTSATDTKWQTTDPKFYEFYNKPLERIPVCFGVNAPTNPVMAYGVIPMAAFILGKDQTMLDKKTLTFSQRAMNINGVDTMVTDTTTGYVWDGNKRLPWLLGSAATTAALLLLQNMLDMNVSPDVLSFEFEYWTNRYPNTYQMVYNDFLSIPEPAPSNPTFKHNRWRWSMKTEKKIGNFFAKLQVAHDHRLPFIARYDMWETIDGLGAAGLWQWDLKTGVTF